MNAYYHLFPAATTGHINRESLLADHVRVFGPAYEAYIINVYPCNQDAMDKLVLCAKWKI